jgi:hypothetical protein
MCAAVLFCCRVAYRMQLIELQHVGACIHAVASNLWLLAEASPSMLINMIAAFAARVDCLPTTRVLLAYWLLTTIFLTICFIITCVLLAHWFVYCCRMGRQAPPRPLVYCLYICVHVSQQSLGWRLCKTTCVTVSILLCTAAECCTRLPSSLLTTCRTILPLVCSLILYCLLTGL